MRRLPREHAPLLRALVALTLGLVLVGCTPFDSRSGPAPTTSAYSVSMPGDSSTAPAEQTAQEVVRVTSVHEATGMTLLEGPTFGPNGDLYMVDVTAPPGGPKVLRMDFRSREISTVYTDYTSAFTSAQFSPLDGRLYLTDYLGGTVQSITAEGEDAQVHVSGAVEGTMMNPDDIAFDEAGNLYITDTIGAQEPYWEAEGRLLRVAVGSNEVTVLAENLAAPNGIAYTPNFDGLWVTHNTGNQVDYLRLNEGGTEVMTAHPAIHVDAGVSQVDSAAVDANGNLYIGLHNRAAILVHDRNGNRISTITIPNRDGGLSSATNIAIVPGTTDAYVTASGSAGGWIYAFDALAPGIRQSNGG